MSLSPEHDFTQGAFQALWKDLEALIPDANKKALGWDKTQLARLTVSRGTRFLTIDLPEVGKALEASLAAGHLIPITSPGFAKLKTKRGRDQRPRLFWAFWSRVFTYNGRLRTHACPLSILALRQLCYHVKKLKGDCDEGKTFAAIREFYVIENEMRTPTLSWDDPFSPFDSGSQLSVGAEDGDEPYNALAGDSPVGWCVEEGKWTQRVFDFLVAHLPVFDPFDVRGRHGPGAVSDGKRGESKYSFPRWPAKLETVFPFDRHGSTCYMQEESYPEDRDVPSKLGVVPKTQKGPRLIASESICNQWVQQGIAKWWSDKAFMGPIYRDSIRLDDQTLSQKAAKAASLGTGATIDLSSASDRLSCHLVERVFRRRPELLSAMMACRTSYIVQSLDRKSPKQIKLRKFSTMGSALTFPVQSFVFFAISLSCTLRVRGLGLNMANVRLCAKEVLAYGDDIIVPASVAPALVRALHALGLKVNESKSHWTGKFRESCGSDWYDGECVTPSYIRSDFDPRTPSTVSTIIETSNNFFLRGMWNVAEFLTSRLPKKILENRIPIVKQLTRDLSEEGSNAAKSDLAVSGLYSFVGSKLNHLKRRFCPDLQVDEYRIGILYAIRAQDKPDGVDRLRQYFTERPDPTIKWDPRCIDRPVPVYRERYAPVYYRPGV